MLAKPMGILAALLSSIVFGIADFAGGYASRQVPAAVVVVLSQAAGWVLVAVAAPLMGGRPSAADMGWGAAAGMAGMLGVVALYRGLAEGVISVVSPLAAIVGAAIPVGFGLAMGERPSLLAAAGVGLALPAIALISTVDGERSGQGANGAALGLAAGVGFGGFFILISRTGDSAGIWPLLSARTSTVLVLGLGLIVTGHLRMPTRARGTIAFAGVADMVANIAFVLAARWTLLATASVITALYPASTLVAARVVFSERTTSVQRVGLALGAVAVGLIALG